MPELHFELRWNDTHSERYYSPSTAVRSFLQQGESYSIPELLERARAAMHLASERVRAKYGFTCSSALDTLARIEQRAEQHAHDPGASVTVVSID